MEDKTKITEFVHNQVKQKIIHQNHSQGSSDNLAKRPKDQKKNEDQLFQDSINKSETELTKFDTGFNKSKLLNKPKSYIEELTSRNVLNMYNDILDVSQAETRTKKIINRLRLKNPGIQNKKLSFVRVLEDNGADHETVNLNDLVQKNDLQEIDTPIIIKHMIEGMYQYNIKEFHGDLQYKNFNLIMYGDNILRVEVTKPHFGLFNNKLESQSVDKLLELHDFTQLPSEVLIHILIKKGQLKEINQEVVLEKLPVRLQNECAAIIINMIKNKNEINQIKQDSQTFACLIFNIIAGENVLFEEFKKKNPYIKSLEMKLSNNEFVIQYLSFLFEFLNNKNRLKVLIKQKIDKFLNEMVKEQWEKLDHIKMDSILFDFIQHTLTTDCDYRFDISDIQYLYTASFDFYDRKNNDKEFF